MSEDEVEKLKTIWKAILKSAFYDECNVIQLYQVKSGLLVNLKIYERPTVEEVINNLLKQLNTAIHQGLKYFSCSVNSQTFKNIGFFFDASKYILDVEKEYVENREGICSVRNFSEM